MSLLAASQRRRHRRGMTLIEILVVIAILLVLAAVAMPALDTLMQLEQRRVAKDLALTYELLHDEAVMRNVTFRIAYHLDGGYYTIEVGDPTTLIYDDPEQRKDAEEERAHKMRLHTKREIEEGEGAEESPFAALEDQLPSKVQLPDGTRFGGVYTPQYGELVEPSGTDESTDPDEAVVVYSYIFASGFSEHTVVYLVEADDPTEGYTVEVEPLSGRVHLFTELIEWQGRMGDIPERGPDLP